MPASVSSQTIPDQVLLELKSGRFEAAICLLDAAPAILQSDQYCLYLRALCLWGLMQAEAALILFDRCLALKDDLPTRLSRTQLLQAMDQHELALDELRVIGGGSYPIQSPALVFTTGKSLIALNYDDSWLSLLDISVSTFPNQLALTVAHGLWLLHCGELAKGMNVLKGLMLRKAASGMDRNCLATALAYLDEHLLAANTVWQLNYFASIRNRSKYPMHPKESFAAHSPGAYQSPDHDLLAMDPDLEFVTAPSAEHSDLIGENGRAALVSADKAYFWRHVPKLLQQWQTKAGEMPLIIHLMQEHDLEAAQCNLLFASASSLKVLLVHDRAPLQVAESAQRRAYFACRRFMILPKVQRRLQCDILLMDVDVVIKTNLMKLIDPIYTSQTDIAVHDRLGEVHINQRIAAGVFFAKSNDQASRFTHLVARFLVDAYRKSHLRWFADQMALFAAYRAFFDHDDCRVQSFAESAISYSLLNERAILCFPKPLTFG